MAMDTAKYPTHNKCEHGHEHGSDDIKTKNSIHQYSDKYLRKMRALHDKVQTFEELYVCPSRRTKRAISGRPLPLSRARLAATSAPA